MQSEQIELHRPDRGDGRLYRAPIVVRQERVEDTMTAGNPVLFHDETQAILKPRGCKTSMAVTGPGGRQATEAAQHRDPATGQAVDLVGDLVCADARELLAVGCPKVLEVRDRIHPLAGSKCRDPWRAPLIQRGEPREIPIRT